ncbi:MAG: hypothetical protein LBK94_11245 [Prevotellaceae bacterium]|jgi:hypothetical protein|nr:hypothetical protein [Prevotellaceae bacterium]
MDCKVLGGNTGVGACDVLAQRIDGVIFTPKTAKIPKDTTDLLDYLLQQFNQADKGKRFFPLLGIGQATNSSEEAQVGTLGYGASIKQRNGNEIIRWDLPFSFCKSKVVTPFDGWNQGIYLVSSEGLLIGKNSLDKKDLIPFIPQQFDVVDVQPISLGTSDVQLIGIQVNFGDKLRFTDLMEFLEIGDYDADLLQGLTDVDLTVAGHATGYVDVKVTTKCGGVDLFDTYQTELANADVWSAINKATGSSVTPSGVTAQAVTKSFRISITAATYLLSLASITVLKENGIEGYESNQITVTVQ